jgi:hypothetical protein
MDIKQILKDKINALFDERKPLVEEFEQYHTYVKYPDITRLNGEIQAYTDCANLIEQSEKPMKAIPNRFFFECPKCHEYLASTYPHCPYCGQLLDYGQGENK